MAVTFHEAVWVVAGTAAPVIALAVVVSLGETTKQFIAFKSEYMDDPIPPDQYDWLFERRQRQYFWVSGVGLFNLLMQATL